LSFDVRQTSSYDELVDAVLAVGQYFLLEPGSERVERFSKNLPLERMYAAREDGRVVGGAGSFPFELTVPGSAIPVAGVTAVGTYPTDRRRGVLRSLMRAQLDDVHERGEPLAALWASEETIYGRFGYGIASWAGQLTVQHEWDGFADTFESAGATRFVTPEEARKLFPPVYDAVRRERPGMTSRGDVWWEERHLRLEEDEKDAPRRFVVLEADGEPQAYAIYRTRFSFEGGLPASRLIVREALGATPAATATIWRFLLDVDWMAQVEVSLAPPDHPLFLLLALPRRARYRMHDGLWVRIVDLPAALSGRAYGEGGPLVLEVRDAVCEWNDGRWKLENGACEGTEEEPDLALDVSALGSAYLGAVPFNQLREALRVEELREGAVERADALFAWRPLPWSIEIF
jgi:predicted acetyltransferase